MKKHAILTRASLLLFAACIALLIAGGLITLAAYVQPVKAFVDAPEDQAVIQAPPDPLSNTISGEVSYSGAITKTYEVIVSAIVDGSSGPPASTTIIPQVGPYTLTQVPAGAYFIFAYMDLGGDKGPPQPGEPRGWYDQGGDGTPDLVILPEGGSLTGIDVTLRELSISFFLPVVSRNSGSR